MFDFLNSKKSGKKGKSQVDGDNLVEITEEPEMTLEEKQNKDLEALKSFENKISSNEIQPDTSGDFSTSEIERRRLDALKLDNPFTGK